MKTMILGFLSAAATDPTTRGSAAVVISSDKPLWINFGFIFLVFCCYLVWDVTFSLNVGVFAYPRRKVQSRITPPKRCRFRSGFQLLDERSHGPTDKSPL